MKKTIEDIEDFIVEQVKLIKGALKSHPTAQIEGKTLLTLSTIYKNLKEATK